MNTAAVNMKIQLSPFVFGICETDKGKRKRDTRREESQSKRAEKVSYKASGIGKPKVSLLKAFQTFLRKEALILLSQLIHHQAVTDRQVDGNSLSSRASRMKYLFFCYKL